MSTRSVTITLPTPDFSTVWGLDFTPPQELELAKIFVTCLDLEMAWDLDLSVDEDRHDVKLELVQGSSNECVLSWDADRTMPVCDAASLREAADRVVPSGEWQDAHPDLRDAVDGMVLAVPDQDPDGSLASVIGATHSDMALRDQFSIPAARYREIATMLVRVVAEARNVAGDNLDVCAQVMVTEDGSHVLYVFGDQADATLIELPEAQDPDAALRAEVASWFLGPQVEADSEERESKTSIWWNDLSSDTITYHARYE